MFGYKYVGFYNLFYKYLKYDDKGNILEIYDKLIGKIDVVVM